MKIFNLLKNLYKRAKSNIENALDEAKGYTADIAKDFVKIGLFTGGTVTVPAGGAVQATVNFTVPSGYKTVDILNARTNGDELSVYASGLTTATQASAWVRNWNSNQRAVTVTVFILFIKNVGVILNRIFREAVTV